MKIRFHIIQYYQVKFLLLSQYLFPPDFPCFTFLFYAPVPNMNQPEAGKPSLPYLLSWWNKLEIYALPTSTHTGWVL